MSNSSSTATNGSKHPISNYFLVPIILIITFIPLIVKIHMYDNNLSNFNWYSTNDSVIDVFLYYKSVSFIFICSFLLLFMCYRFIIDRKLYKFNKIFIPLIIYSIMVILSSIFSDYKYFSVHGIYEQFESIFVILGYVLVAYYTYIIIETEHQIKLIFKWWQYSIIIICFIGLTQFIGNDFFNTSFGRKLIAADGYDFTFTFAKHTVYSTLYNPNYVGFYSSLVAPIILVLALFSKNKLTIIKYILTFLALILCMFGSGSRNGFICIAITMIFIFIFLRNRIINNWIPILSGFLIIIVAFFITNAVTNNLFVNRIKNIIHINTTTHSLSKIETNKDDVVISYKNSTIHIKMDSNIIETNYLHFFDSNLNTINSTYDPYSQSFTLNDEKYSGISIKQVTLENLDNIYAFVVNIDGSDWVFTNQTTDGTYYYYNRFGKLDKILIPETSVFTDYESLAGGRGFIWSRTLPLLKHYMVLGSGADTFSLVYPQQDYVGMYNNGFGTSIMSKPHSLYLQIGVQTGVLSLVAFIIFYLIYFITSIKLYIKNNFNTYFSQAGVAIFVGTIGYMISGLANDSTITVAPVFWVLIGLGIAINNKVKLEN